LPNERDRRTRLQAVRNAYTSAALIVFNALLFLLLLNATIAAAQWGWRRLHKAELGPEVRAYGFDKVLKAYGGWRRDDLSALLAESTQSNRWEYEAYTVFRPSPFRGRFINISADGYRQTDQPAPWPPSPKAFNVFWFGGSTAFGLGIPDRETIPAHLQRALPATICGRPVVVYNFARPSYFSVQERVLFEKLLGANVHPDLAIFFDGLNDFGYRDPAMTPALSRMVDEATNGRFRDRFVDLSMALPIARLSILRSRHVSQQAGDGETMSSGLTPSEVVRRWLDNRMMIKAVAAQFATQVVFVWQPIPNYGYDSKYHLFSDPIGFAGWGSAEGYSLMSGLRARGGLPDDLLWLADLQRGLHENLYVDRYHYTPQFSKVIAEAVAPFVRDSLACSPPRKLSITPAPQEPESLVASH
jgi:hypothetical protein